jgi:hypothetical protein
MADVYDRIKRLSKLRETPNRASLIQITDIMTGVAPGSVPISLPPGAVPSETPPSPITGGGTLTFTVGASDDQDVQARGATYPPSGSIVHNSDPLHLYISKYAESIGNPQPFYTVIGLLRFDTSAIPDNATITSAIVKTVIRLVRNDNSRSLTAEYATWDGSDADYTTTVGTNANAGIPLSTIAPGPFDIPLLNPNANINKTGTTYFKFHISGAQAGYNQFNTVEFTTVERSADEASKLIVTYV